MAILAPDLRLQERIDGTHPVPPHLQLAYVELGCGAEAFPLSEAIHREVLSLPIGPHLTPTQQTPIINLLRQIC